jgi:hypothetical protein
MDNRGARGIRTLRLAIDDDCGDPLSREGRCKGEARGACPDDLDVGLRGSGG